ncbi:MAG TPA: response regulator transcription factor [Microbacteriaceae bacterium]
MPESPRLLLIEDDGQLSSMLGRLLTSEGYDVAHASDGQKGLHRGLTESFDVMIIDRGLPVVAGLDLLTALRRNGVATPALVLSALGNPSDRVEGLDAGAEDYMSKPFDIDELLARLRSVRRRATSTIELLGIAGGKLDTQRRIVYLDDESTVTLSARECALLEELSRWPNRVFSRDELREYVFANAEEDGIVDTYVHYLRRKLGRHVVRTVYGVGYTLGTGR